LRNQDNYEELNDAIANDEIPVISKVDNVTLNDLFCFKA
jgi:hypothetical protein